MVANRYGSVVGEGFARHPPATRTGANRGAKLLMRLAVLAIEQLANGAAASVIQFAMGIALVGIHRKVSATVRLGLTACRATVGETGLVRLQFKLFRANHTNFDGKRH